MNGWIRLHRKILQNPVVMKDADHFAVWVYLLLNASHGDCEVLFGNNRIKLDIGQLAPTSRKKIASDLHISESKVERILKSFEIEQQIEQQTNSRNRLISITNWDKYQKNEQPNERNANSRRTASEQQVNTINNIKNGNNIENGINNNNIPPKSPKGESELYSMIDDMNFPQELASAMKEWLQYKKEKRQTYKPVGFKKLLAQVNENFEKYGEHAVIDCMNLSMVNNWQGIIWDKIKANKSKPNFEEERFLNNRRSAKEKPVEEEPEEELTEEEWHKMIDEMPPIDWGDVE